MTNLRGDWTVYVGGDGGPGGEVVRKFVLFNGGGTKRMGTTKDETKPERVPESAAPWVIPFAEAVAAVRATAEDAFRVAVEVLKHAHVEEIGRIEARLFREREAEVSRIKAEHQRQMDALRQQHAVHVATQTAGMEKALQHVDAGHQVFHAGNEAVSAEIVAALTAENEELRMKLKRR